MEEANALKIRNNLGEILDRFGLTPMRCTDQSNVIRVL